MDIWMDGWMALDSSHILGLRSDTQREGESFNWSERRYHLMMFDWLWVDVRDRFDGSVLGAF